MSAAQRLAGRRERAPASAELEEGLCDVMREERHLEAMAHLDIQVALGMKGGKG